MAKKATRKRKTKKTAPPASYWDFAKQTFEQGLEGVMKVANQNGTKTKEHLIKNFDELIDQLGAIELKEKALEKTEGLRKELKKKSKKVVKELKKKDWNFVDPHIIDDVKENISTAVSQVNTAEFFEHAKDRVLSTKKHVLGMLDIPTQTDINTLTRKVASLEKKLRTKTKRKGR